MRRLVENLLLFVFGRLDPIDDQPVADAQRRWLSKNEPSPWNWSWPTDTWLQKQMKKGD